MAKFKNTTTGVVVSVDDRKADRYAVGWEPVDDEKVDAAAKSAAPKTSSK